MRASKTHKVHLFAFATWYCHLWSQVHGECGYMPRSSLLETYLHAWPSAPETGAAFACSILSPSPATLEPSFATSVFFSVPGWCHLSLICFPLHFCFSASIFFSYHAMRAEYIYRLKVKSRFFLLSQLFFFLKKEIKSLNSSLNEQLKMEFS